MNRYEEMAMIGNKWTPPPELGSYGSRRVRLSKYGKVLAAAAVALILGAGLVGVLAGRASTRQAEQARQLEQQGQNTDAVITRLWKPGGEEDTHKVGYWFAVEGRTYKDEVSVPSRLWKKMKTGDTLPVRFLPSNPDVNHPLAWRKSLLSIWIAILFPAGMVLFSLYIGRVILRQIDLLENGRPALAVITRVRKVSQAHGKHTVILNYEFALMSGGIGRGKTDSSNKSLVQGSTITIVYDPNNPRRTARYPMALVRIDRS